MSEATQALEPAKPIRRRREEKRIEVKLTDKSAPVLVGTELKYPGDTIMLRFQQAKELVQDGLAVLVDLAATIFPPVPESAQARSAPPARSTRWGLV